MSHPTSASGQSTSFNTNVNRAKTKKWVEAKSYSYDGDDWGEVDDYDEYGGYDQSPLEVKPTGLRQRGQSASQTTQGPYDARHDLYQSPVDDRPGNTGGPHRQQQCGGRSVTNSQPQAYPAGARRNSFDPEDDRRAFSAGDPSQNISNAAATEYPTAQVPQVQSTVAQDFQSGPFFPNLSFRTQPGPTGPLLHIPGRTSMEDQVRYEQQAQSPSGSNRSGFYPDHPPPPDMGSRTQSMTSNTSVQDLHHRRDFSPSAVPPPLQTRGSPSLHGNSDSRSFSWHPPRKSSLSQDTPPTLPFPMQLPPISSVRDPEEELPPLRERSGSNGKQLPFVRPADIYRRMQEEKEKERQSQESSRPSMDSIMGKSSDRPSLGKSQNCESSQRLKPTLVSVTERKSEYDLEGVDLGNQVTPEEPRPTAKIFELPTRTSNTTSQNTTSSLRPMLPDVSRVSGFGESFFGTPRGSNEQSDETHPEPPTLSHAAVQDQPGNNDLQYQLSPGFTSAVHQAFDSAEDQVPPTPTSTADSTIGRSASGGTSTVSPIISRGPSAVTENRNSKLPGIDDVTISTSGEAPATSSTRPLSSSSLGTPKQIARKPSPSQLAMPRASESPPPSFIPGHRRDLSTPSPDNSPARTPAVEVSRQLRQPQEVEISRGSPTDPSPTSRSSSQVSEITSGEGSDITRSTLEVSRFRGGPSVDSRSVARNAQGKADSATSSISHPQHYLRSRTDSGGSSRVRNLADKFESASRPGSAHSTTPRASMLGNHEQRKNELDPLRPLADRMESFRPHLPGGWESSASIAPAANVAGLQLASETQPTESTTKSVVPDTNWTGDDGSNDEVTEHSGQAPSTAVQIKDASEEAFTAVAAAGTALAGAFAAAVGMDQHSSPSGIIPQTPPDQEFREKESQDSGPNITKPDASMNKAFNPEALRPDMPYFMDDDTSTADSTPLPKNAPLHLTEDPETRDYFTSASQDQDSFEKPGSLEEPAVEKRPPILPSLSTDIKTHEYESDRLHREIVRELSPMVTSEPTTAESDFSNHDNVSRFSANANLPRPGHDSGVLPREYESYWNEANSDDDLHQSDGEPGGLEDATTAKRQQGAAVVGEPLHPRKSEQTTHSGPTIQDGAFPNSPHVLQHHFSWEQLRQGLPSAPPDSIHEAAPAPESNIFSSAIYPGGRDFHLHDEQQNHDDADQMSQIPTTAIPISNDSSRLSEGNVPIPGAENFFSSRSATLNVERDLSGYSGGLEVAPTLSENQLTKPVDVSAGSTNSVAFESPAMPSERGQESERPPPVPILSQPSPQVVPAQDDGLRPLPPNAQPKIPAFRELLALKSPSDRIRAYNNTRQQFADLNTGLAHWLAATTKDLPEHADLLKNTGSPAFQGHKPSPSRSKLGGLRQSGGQPGQQHYLQQHLNASPQPSLSDGAGPGGAPQGYSPSGGSGGKLSSQQVQAKGKDLLHTAGIFGGKANVAAKGLFSKGRSKLKGSGGADKATTSPPYSAAQTTLDPCAVVKSTVSPAALPTHEPSQTSAQISFSQPATSHLPDRHVSFNSALPRYEFPDPQHVAQPDERRLPSQTVAHTPKCAQAKEGNMPARITLPQHQLLIHERRSPRDLPSSESFTRSQEGDDELSEASAPDDTEHRPGASSFYLKHGNASQTNQNPAAIDNVPKSPRKTSSTNTHVGSREEIQTPRSASSSNKTPTQANFTDISQPAMPSHSPGAVDKSYTQHRNSDNSAGYANAQASPTKFSPPQSRYSTQFPINIDVSNGHDSDSETPQRSSRESENVSHSAGSAADHLDLSAPMSETSIRHTTSINEQHGRDIYKPEHLRFRTDAQNSRGSLSKVRPISPMNESLNPLHQPHEYLPGSSSMKNMPSRVNAGQPPSPVSPWRPPEKNEILEQRGRRGPVHYGIGHDFGPPSEPERSRSCSYSRQLRDSRRSQDSRSSQDPNFREYPAFWQGGPAVSGSVIPLQFNAGQSTHEEALNSYQQTPQNQLDGIGPPVGRRSESRSRSRRGSRSSAFFKSFVSPSRSEIPPLPNGPDSQASSSAVNPPATDDRWSKRSSIFRSLTRNNDNGSGGRLSKETGRPHDSLTHVAQQAGPDTPRHVGKASYSIDGSSRLSKKLQRASKSAKPEQDTGQKRRFSAIVTLFGRSSQKRQSTGLPQTGSQQSPPAQIQDQDPHNEVAAYERDTSPPPREVYYAPTNFDSRSPGASSRTPYNGHTHSHAQDLPAYMQDSSLRVQQLMSSPTRVQDSTSPHSSATSPQSNRQSSSTSVPNSSKSDHNESCEEFPQRPRKASRSSGNPWTRFSTRSKSRQSQTRPLSGEISSPPPPITNVPPPPSHSFAIGRRSFHDPSRSDSPTPPPPPPKDEWHHPRPRESSSTFSALGNRQQKHSPSQAPASRPDSTQYRQSLPPIQTHITSPRKSAKNPDKTLAPEEKRRSRQMEIENSGMTPKSRINSGTTNVRGDEQDDENKTPVMSATSFPNQMWQPDMANWEGDER